MHPQWLTASVCLLVASWLLLPLFLLKDYHTLLITAHLQAGWHSLLSSAILYAIICMHIYYAAIQQLFYHLLDFLGHFFLPFMGGYFYQKKSPGIFIFLPSLCL